MVGRKIGNGPGVSRKASRHWMEKTARTMFSDGERYPTTKEVQLLLTLRLVSVVVTSYRLSIQPYLGWRILKRTSGTFLRRGCRWMTWFIMEALLLSTRTSWIVRRTTCPLTTRPLYHLINVGVRDMDASDKPWDVSTCSMRYAACLGDCLWTMITREQNRVGVFCFFIWLRN